MTCIVLIILLFYKLSHIPYKIYKRHLVIFLEKKDALIDSMLFKSKIFTNI